MLDLFPTGDKADDVTGVSLMKVAYSQETPSSPEVNQLFARLTEVNNLTLHQVKMYVGSNTGSVKRPILPKIMNTGSLTVTYVRYTRYAWLRDSL